MINQERFTSSSVNEIQDLSRSPIRGFGVPGVEDGRPSDTKCWAIEGEMFRSFDMLIAKTAFVVDPGVFFVFMPLQVTEACDPLDAGAKVGSRKFLEKKGFGYVRRRKPDFCSTVVVSVAPFFAPSGKGVFLILLLQKSWTRSNFVIRRKGGALFS